MTDPILPAIDEAAVSDIINNQPQSLIIQTENGLDCDLVVEKLINAETSDKLTIQPEDGKSQITVQQIRSLAHSLRTFAARRRVVVINPADSMNEESQNALLKMLEEPSKNLHFILVTYNVSAILETVQSRCQTLTLHRTSALQDNSLLKNSDLDDLTKQQIRFLASGRPALIRQIIRQPKLLNQYQETASSAKVIMQGVSYISLVESQKFSTNREEALKLIDILLTMIRFQIKSKGPTPEINGLLDRVFRAEDSLKSNGNIKLALLQLMI